VFTGTGDAPLRLRRSCLALYWLAKNHVFTIGTEVRVQIALSEYLPKDTNANGPVRLAAGLGLQNVATRDFSNCGLQGICYGGKTW